MLRHFEVKHPDIACDIIITDADITAMKKCKKIGLFSSHIVNGFHSGRSVRFSKFTVKISLVTPKISLLYVILPIILCNQIISVCVHPFIDTIILVFALSAVV